MQVQIRRPSGRLSIVVLLGFLWFCSAFLGGYLLGEADASTGTRRLGDLTLKVDALLGRQPPTNPLASAAGLSAEQQARFKVFWEAWGLVEKEFFDRPAIDSQKMTYGAVKGMIDSLGDPNSAFSSPREKEMTDASLRGSFDGVGVQVDQRDGQLRVIAPLEGAPAERAGMRAGDVIVQVDGRDLKGRTLNDVVLLIRGQRGTSVSLTVLREGEPRPLTFAIERAEIKLDTVKSKLLDGGLGYVRITSFSTNTGPDAAAAVKSLVQQGPRGLVLDLRSNPGGFLTAAVDVASQFLGDGVVLYQQPVSGERQEYRARAGGQATTLPVVVLIDRGSASASEIVAAALHDNGRAILLGEKSYGKGSVQSVHTLSDASGLRITSAVWLTPSGRPLERQGLEPDVTVGPGFDASTGLDAQLEAAVQYLQAHAGTSLLVGGV